MASFLEDLTVEVLNGGRLIEDINAGLREVEDHIKRNPHILGVRKLTVSIDILPDQEHDFGSAQYMAEIHTKVKTGMPGLTQVCRALTQDGRIVVNVQEPEQPGQRPLEFKKDGTNEG